MTDPRFDPAFQRGYSGPEPELVLRPAPAANTHAQAPSPLAPPTPAPTLQSTSTPTSTAPAQLPSAAGLMTGEESQPWPPRRNPFAIALLVVSLVMLVGGGWLMQAWVSMSTDGYTPEQQATAIMEQQLAPALLLGGIVGAVAWLVFGALGVSASRERL